MAVKAHQLHSDFGGTGTVRHASGRDHRPEWALAGPRPRNKRGLRALLTKIVPAGNGAPVNSRG